MLFVKRNYFISVLQIQSNLSTPKGFIEHVSTSMVSKQHLNGWYLNGLYFIAPEWVVSNTSVTTCLRTKPLAERSEHFNGLAIDRTNNEKQEL